MRVPNFLKLLTFGLIAGAIADWFTGHNEIKLFGVHVYFVLSILSIAAGLLAGKISKMNPMAICGVVTLGIGLAVVLKVIYDGSSNDSSHNLWPFEVIVFGMIGFLSSLVGVFTTILITGRKV